MSNKTKPNPAPAILKGIKPLDPKSALAQATPEQVSTLMQTNFALWSQYSGIEVDHAKFDFDKHRYLLPMYLDTSKEIVLLKAAQMGATIYMLLRLLWFCRYQQVKCGLYFPTADGVNTLSKDRLTPLLRSNKELYESVKDDASDTLGLKQIENIHGKRSSLYMLYLGGTASKDSVPLDIIAFDEVRLVEPSDIDQALERISHSSYKYKMFMSTAGMPGLDIDKRFKLGTQLYWHVKCLCHDGFIPSDVFPDCIVDTGKEVYMRCPKCKLRILDPQNGNYIAHNPKADFPSYHISQLISKFTTPKEIWTMYQTTTNKKEFYNAKLGRPFIDAENMPITEDVLDNCVNTSINWAMSEAKDSPLRRRCAMGVDQMSGNNYVVITKKGINGKKHIVHLEIIESGNPRYWENGKPITPFKRLYELMREFDVGVCVIDAMPSANEAQDFARAFPGRVFLSWYGDGGVDLAKWHDRLKMKEQLRKGSKEIKLKWQVTLHRYMSLDWTMNDFVERNIEMPNPDALVQVVRNEDTGRYEAENICRRFRTHLRSLVREKEIIDELSGKFKLVYKYVGRDPHFAHAMNYCNIAYERLRKVAIFSF